MVVREARNERARRWRQQVDRDPALAPHGEDRTIELAIVARAPVDLINRLGWASGLLDAVSQLPLDGGPAQALTVSLINDARAAVDPWKRWGKGRTPAA